MILAPPRAGLRFCVHKSSACQEKKIGSRSIQTKGSLREGAPDGVGGGRARYNKVSSNLKSRGLLPSPNGATFLPEEGFDLIPLKRVNVTIAWLSGQ